MGCEVRALHLWPARGRKPVLLKTALMKNIPFWPRILGLAGLLPQLACLAMLITGPAEWRFAALALAWGYAALIFSFLGGLWWGIAASALRGGEPAPDWLWLAAVAPSLIAFASYLPWVFAAPWPQPSLVVIAVALIASLSVDRAIAGLAPAWWFGLRAVLSIGLGLATLGIAFL